MAVQGGSLTPTLPFLVAAYVLLSFSAWTLLYNLTVVEQFTKALNCSAKVLLEKLFVYNSDNFEDDYYEEWTTDGTAYRLRGHQDFLHEFSFSITPKNVSCRRNGRSLNSRAIFVVIKSRPHEFFQRMAIRQTYGRLLGRRFIFVVGRYLRDPEVDTAVALEARQFGDILKINFSDTYRNLGFKSMAILRWIVKYCPYEPFYVQADSDALLYPKNLFAFVRQKMGTVRHIYGHCWHNAPVLRRGKWRVSMSDYAGSHYPEYCAGAAYLMTGDVPAALLRALAAPYPLGGAPLKLPFHAAPMDDSSSVHTAAWINEPYLSVDDAYFTGLLSERAVINRVHHGGFVLWNEFRRTLIRSGDGSANCSAPYRTFLASFEHKSPDDMRRVWSNYQRTDAQC